jgi:hypothetical protein
MRKSLIVIANPSQSSTLAGRSKKPTHDQNQPKSLSAQTHGRLQFDRYYDEEQ